MSKIALSWFCGGDTSRRFSDLTPTFDAQLSSVKRFVDLNVVSCVAAIDSPQLGSFYRVVNPVPFHDEIINIPEINTGDPDSIIEFLRYSFQFSISASENVFILSGHGLAWDDLTMWDALKPLTPIPRFSFQTRSYLPDESSRDFLSNGEITKLFGDIRRLLGESFIRMVVFDGCSMSSIEVLHSVGGVAEFALGSFDELPQRGIDFGASIRECVYSGAVSPESLALNALREFGRANEIESPFHIGYGPGYFTLFLVRINKVAVNILSNNINIVVDALEAFLSASSSNRSSFINIVERFNVRLFRLKHIVDLKSLLVGMSYAAPSIRGLIDESIFRIFFSGEVVVAGYAGAKYRGVGGISVFWPRNHAEYLRFRETYGTLEFSMKTRWLRLLDLLFL